MAWSEASIPDQSGRVVVVTGSNTGIGFETARALTQRGAHVVLACRSEERGAAAVARIRATGPAGTCESETLDLADLDSVSAFAQRMRTQHDHIDTLVNNAGVMIPPRSFTRDGFELQFGVNHLGHFALTGQLLPLLLGREGARVVNVSSMAHRQGVINFGNLKGEKRYVAFREYGQSKLANLLFTFELNRRLEATQQSLIAVAAHPGVTQTELTRHNGFIERLAGWFAMPTVQGAWPLMLAATGQEVQRGDYYGPDGFLEAWGKPGSAKIRPRGRNPEVAARLWEVSQEATGVEYAWMSSVQGAVEE